MTEGCSIIGGPELVGVRFSLLADPHIEMCNLLSEVLGCTTVRSIKSTGLMSFTSAC